MRRQLLNLFAVLAVFLCVAVPLSLRGRPGAAAAHEAPREVGAYRVAAGAAKTPAPRGAQVRLTASDGTGLRLARLAARAVVDSPLAFTELRLAFDNPTDRTLEGTFTIVLPPGAAVSRLAMKLGERWQEGEVVERHAARRAYEDALHRRQDPALLEQGAGNDFTARVFPIPPRATKELVVSYSEELVGGVPYRLPLAGLPEVGELDVVATTGDGAPIASLHRAAFTPDADFALDLARPASGDGVRSGELVIARARPVPDAAPDPLAGVLVFVDTSASRALGLDDELGVLERLAGAIAKASGGATPLAVSCFDQRVQPVFRGTAGELAARHLEAIRARQALGASDLERALVWAREHAGGSGARRVVLVTDGVATAGATEARALALAARGLADGGVERLDVIAVGGLRDEALLRRLVTAGLPRDGVVIDAASGPAALASRLSRATRSGIEVDPGRDVGLAAPPRRRAAGRRGARLRDRARGHAGRAVARRRAGARPVARARRTAARRARTRQGEDREPARGRGRGRGRAQRARELVGEPPRHEPAHRARRARDRARLPALRHRSARARRRAHGRGRARGGRAAEPAGRAS
jgi:hypothetical protein